MPQVYDPGDIAELIAQQGIEAAELMADPTADRCVAFAKKWMPETAHFDPKKMLAGIHRARIEAGTIKQATESVAWLEDNGFPVHGLPKS